MSGKRKFEPQPLTRSSNFAALVISLLHAQASLHGPLHPLCIGFGQDPSIGASETRSLFAFTTWLCVTTPHAPHTMLQSGRLSIAANTADHTLESCIALHSYRAEDPTELSLSPGDVVLVRAHEGEWSFGECGGRRGWFPALFVAPKGAESTSKLHDLAKTCSPASQPGEWMVVVVAISLRSTW